ncbi:MAG: glycosyltransferase family 4 protein [Flavobacteriales bacterium]|nr:glycosyltransferase family 4 protein [Flavobacteriales bacterium]
MSNICFFNSVKFWGGGEKFYLDYAVEMQNRGHNVFVVCGHNSVLSQKAKESKLSQFNIKVSMFSALNPFKVFNLVSFFKEKEIDAVIFSTSQDLKLGGITAKLAGVKNIAFRRGLAVPIKNRFVNRILFKNILTHILANSIKTKNTILKNLSSHIPEDKITVIYNGIDIQKSNEITQCISVIKEKGNGIILGNAGRLTKQKGQLHLIELAKILKSRGLEFTIFIAGTGGLKDKLAKEISDNKLSDEVILLDFIDRIEEFMNSIDVFLLSSMWEGFGYVLVEAMVKSKPVVAFDMTSNPEIIGDKETGFLIEYPDLEKFADQVEELIKNPEQRNKMGTAGLRRVKDKFLLKDRMNDFEKFLLEQKG